MTDSDHQHFSMDGVGVPTAPGVFVDPATIPAVEFVPGLRFQPTLGENTLANLVSFEPHTEAPMHAHVEEQVVIVLEGEFDFTLDGETRTMRPGDIAVIPPWVPHGAITRDTRCVEVDVFSPPRTTLLAHADRAAGTPADSGEDGP
jgi:quercetin dioxygenase-like cupin family protein